MRHLNTQHALAASAARSRSAARHLYVFKPYIVLRLAPTTCAAAPAQVRCGEVVVATALKGRWVRVQVPPREGDGAELERWALTWHPIHGELLRQLDATPEGEPQVPAPGTGLDTL